MGIFDRLFGKKPAPTGFTAVRRPDGSVVMVDALTLEYMNSKAPQPTRESLAAVLAKATRIRVIEGGMAGGKALGTRVLIDTERPADLEGLRAVLQIKPEGAGHCMCVGGEAIEIHAAGKLLAVFGLHHGHSIRWDAWRDDADLEEPERFLEWLASLGAPGPLNDFRKDKRDGEEMEAAWKKWTLVAPAPLRSLLPDAVAEKVGPAELLLALEAGMPDEIERVRSLFRWFGDSMGPWNGFPTYQKVPLRILQQIRLETLVASATGAPDAALLEGAARFFSAASFESVRQRNPGWLPPKLKTLLLTHVLKSSDQDKRERAKAAFG